MKKFSLLVFLSVLFLMGGGREVYASLGTWTDANSPALPPSSSPSGNIISGVYSGTSSADGLKIAVITSGGNIHTSIDGGATWVQRTSSGGRVWRSISSSADGTKLAAVVEGGYIYTSTDGGATWTERTSAGNRAWYSVASSSDGTKLVSVANGGYIYTSTDGGTTWVARVSVGSRAWRSIASSSDGTKLLAVVFSGYIYTSTDGGVTWNSELVPDTREWTSISLSADGNRVIATATNSRIWTYIGGVPPVTTDSAAVDATTGTAATLYGSVLDLVGTASANVGFQYATDAVYLSTGTYTTTTPTSSPSILGSFNQSISGLACNTLYHYRAYSTNSLGTVHGVDKLFATFTTAPCGVPTITTNSATDISQTGATLKGTLSSTGGTSSVTTYFRYSTTSGFSSGSTATASVVLSAPSALSTPITGLTCNTPYFYRAYAETGGVISALGSEVSFTTSACPPSVTTLGATSVGFTSGATLNGNLTSTGGSSATVSFEYGTTTAYGLVATPSTPAMTAPGMFSAGVTSGLSCNTTYNYRARAVSPSGTVFGSNQTFVIPCPTPGVTTGASGSITTTSASVYGMLTSLGGAPSATTYFVYGTTSGLASGGVSTATAVMPTAGPFTRSLTGLSCSTTYYYRAYATISGGLGAVGSESSFTTEPCATPTVTTGSATGVTTTDAVLWGNLTSLGLAPSVVVGVEYGTTPTYGTVSSGVTTSALGPYGVSVSGLSCGTVYYYIAYVTGPAGTVSGSGGVFNTLPCPPVALPAITTVSSGSVTATSAVLNGNLTSMGGLPAVNVNFQYATASGFPSGSTGTASLARTATGAFAQTVTGLSCGTTYFYRAYATSSAPIGGVGSELSFTTPTCSLGFSATTLPASSITPTSAVLNGSLASSLTSSTSVGFEYGLTPSFGTTIVATTPAPSLVSGSFSSIFATGLTCNTTYYYRARASNTGSVVYGSGMTFTTAPCTPVGVVTVNTVAATSVTSSTAILRGTIVSMGTATTATVGFEYGATSTYGSTATAGTVTTSGPFTQSISGLLCGTPYSFRAYATSTGGTATGANVVFTTDPCGSPAVYTGTASLSGRTATLNGLLTFIASWPSATVGFEYGTALTYGSTATVSPAMVATGSFSLPISGLECDTTYYYRAIASGAGGTAQGTRSSFIIPRATCLTGGGVGTDTGAGAGSGGGVRSVPIGGIVTYGSDTPIAQEIADYFAEISFDTLPLVQPARETTPPEVGRTAPRISLNVISSRKIDEDTVVATVSWTALNIAPKTCVGTSTPAVQGWSGESKEPSEDMRPGISRTYQEIIVGIKQEAKISLEGCVGTDGTKIVPASVTVASELAETAEMPAGSEETPRGGGGRNVIIEQI